MRKLNISLFIFLLFLIILNSCETDSGIGQFDSVVIEDEDNPYKFQQLTFTLELKDEVNGYLNLQKIDSLHIMVNGKEWGIFASAVNDTTDYTNKIVNQLSYSYKSVEYLFIAPYVLKTDNLQTAGDFVEYLNDRIVLTPGEYLCELTEVKYKNMAGEWITNKIKTFIGFNVIQNTTSAYLGKIEISID